MVDFDASAFILSFESFFVGQNWIFIIAIVVVAEFFIVVVTIEIDFVMEIVVFVIIVVDFVVVDGRFEVAFVFHLVEAEHDRFIIRSVIFFFDGCVIRVQIACVAGVVAADCCVGDEQFFYVVDGICFVGLFANIIFH